MTPGCVHCSTVGGSDICTDLSYGMIVFSGPVEGCAVCTVLGCQGPRVSVIP